VIPLVSPDVPYEPNFRNTRHAGCKLRQLQALGEDIGKLIGGVHPDETNVAILDHLLREVLPDVDVLCTLASPDDVVTPFDAGIVVLMNRSPSFGVESHVDE
jgi:hypothetical protein